MRAWISRQLRSLADWCHPASRSPLVVFLDGQRAYIEGVEYIEARRIHAEFVRVKRDEPKPSAPAERAKRRGAKP